MQSSLTWAGMRRSRREIQKGQAVVECALVLTVFLVILIAIFDMAQVFFVHQALAERVRKAARVAAVNELDAAEIRNLVLYNQTEVPEGRTSGIFEITPEMVEVRHEGAGTEDARVVVALTSFPYKLLTPMFSGAFQGRRITVAFSTEAP